MTAPPPPAEGGAWISSGQVYGELRRLADEVARVRARLERADDHEHRIRSLERRVRAAAGAAAALGGSIGWLAQGLGG